MSLHIIEHKNTLIKILKDIYTNPRLGALLGFKGGTCAYFFYGLDRFSVDLDFDLLNLEEEKFVFGEMERILTAYGKIKDIQNKRYTLFYLLSYSDKEWNIKVEINKRYFGSQYNLHHYLGISMKIMIKEDMLANKLVALYERQGKTNRDIYDVCFFLRNNWKVNFDIIEKRTGLTYQEFLKKCIQIIEQVSENQILSGIGELLEPKQKLWTKNNLKKDTIFLLNLALENLKEKK